MRTPVEHSRLSVWAFVVLAVLTGPAIPKSQAQARLPIPGERLAPVTPVYDGWYQNPDGTCTLVFGYLNRINQKIEIPLGPDNGLNPHVDDRACSS